LQKQHEGQGPEIGQKGSEARGRIQADWKKRTIGESIPGRGIEHRQTRSEKSRTSSEKKQKEVN
jgi:hypothetical protein